MNKIRKLYQSNHNDRRLLLFILQILLLSTCNGFAVTAADDPNQTVPTDKSRVKLKPVFEVSTTQGKIYKISYTYTFPGKNSIYIKGVGTVPPKGRLKYFSSEKTLKFMDRFSGRDLLEVPITKPIRIMGTSSINMPLESEFPEAFRRGRWQKKESFVESTFAVLDNYFPFGYRAYEKDKVNYYLTTYSDLPKTSERLYAQVSVLIAYSAKAKPPDLVFTLKYKARERRSHTKWRNEISNETKNAVEKFIGKVFEHLQKGIDKKSRKESQDKAKGEKKNSTSN